MASFCDVTILGNIGQDPEITVTSTGMTVARCSIAVSKRLTDRSGNTTTKTEWIKLVAFKRPAEIARDFVKKGQNLVVKGTLQTTSWVDKATDKTLYKTEVVVYGFHFTDSGARPATAGKPAPASDATAPVLADDDDVDLSDFPF